MHIHIIAVAGTGMGALAGLLRQLGHRVSGSDVHFDPPMGPALGQWGVECMEGFRADHLKPAPDLVVIGNVCRSDNAEARAAIDQGLPYTHIAGALQRFALHGTSPLVVTGTHGKTTTTALAAWLLDVAGLNPGFLVGGIPKNFGQSFRAAPPVESAAACPPAWQRAHPFVIEGDEYDTAFFEKTPKFLHYRAEVAIVTSIEHDHVDIYPSFDLYLDAFRRLVTGLPEHGIIIANAADRQVAELVGSTARCPICWYAIEGQTTSANPHWTAAPGPATPEGTPFNLVVGGNSVGQFHTPLPGRHNLSNTVAALAATVEGYGVPLDMAGDALRRFTSVRRRQDLLGVPNGIHVYDDFAHHPTAVRETLAALRDKHPTGKLLAVFEPRSATACRQVHQAEYSLAFDIANQVVLAPLGRSNLSAAERLDTIQLAQSLNTRGIPAVAAGSIDEVVQHLGDVARTGDTIALLSNGAFGGIHAKVLQALAQPSRL